MQMTKTIKKDKGASIRKGRLEVTPVAGSWDYKFYVVNRRNQFLFGFDSKRAAYRYVKELRKDWAIVKVISRDEAMAFVHSPNLETSWTDGYKSIQGITD